MDPWACVFLAKQEKAIIEGEMSYVVPGSSLHLCQPDQSGQRYLLCSVFGLPLTLQALSSMLTLNS